MEAKITKLRDGAELDVKRFYLPGAKLKTICPECGEKVKIDYDNDYLTYPVIGEQTIGLWCELCEYEWELTIDFQIKVKVI